MPRKDFDIDPLTGLPKELGIRESLQQEEQVITVNVEKRKWGKPMTVVKFTNVNKDTDLKKLAKKAKAYCASGGTVKDDRIEVQGDHRRKMRKLLIKLGYPEENINII